MSRPEPETFEVDPKRLQSGRYDHETDREVDRCDISGSYSGDLIAMSGKVRRPFKWRGEMMVCVWSSGRGGISEVKAFRLVPVRFFDGTPTTYSGKTGTSEGAESARNDPLGFYHGMAVSSGKERYVLCGPEVRFVGSEDAVRPEAMQLKPAQLRLF